MKYKITGAVSQTMLSESALSSLVGRLFMASYDMLLDLQIRTERGRVTGCDNPDGSHPLAGRNA